VSSQAAINSKGHQPVVGMPWGRHFQNFVLAVRRGTIQAGFARVQEKSEQVSCLDNMTGPVP